MKKSPVPKIKRTIRIATARLPFATKSALLRAEFARTSRDVHVPIGDVTVTIVAETFRIDYFTLYGALVDRHFDGDVRRRVVLDIGAHKGYFGARVLAGGAATVASFEPASQNFRALRSAAEAASNWDARAEAVGASDGVATLNLAPGSWGHSLQTPVGGESTGTEEVAVVSLTSILREFASGPDLLVKINVEGAAGEMIVGTAPPEWARVSTLWVDIEVNDPVGVDAINDHLATCGLQRRETQGHRSCYVRTRPVGEGR